MNKQQKSARAALAASLPEGEVDGTPLPARVTPEMVAAVDADRCGGCGKHSYESCPRPDYVCFRAHHGGQYLPTSPSDREVNLTQKSQSSDPYDLGAAARNADVCLSDQPYEFGSAEHLEWQEGWLAAKRDNGQFGAGA